MLVLVFSSVHNTVNRAIPRSVLHSKPQRLDSTTTSKGVAATQLAHTRTLPNNHSTLMASLPKRFPFTFAVAYSAAKTVAADLVVQTVIEKREQIDWKRAGVFLGFGTIQVGGGYYFLYNYAFPRFVPSAGTFAAKKFSEKLADVTGQINVVKQVSLEMFVWSPFVYFPVFYLCKESTAERSHRVEEEGTRQREAHNPVQRAFHSYSQNIASDMRGFWSVWMPAAFMNFGFMPMHLRVPFTASIGLFYCGYLSASRGTLNAAKADPHLARQGHQMQDARYCRETSLRWSETGARSASAVSA
eukprot:3933056-Rhodomonas_salina.1